MFGLIRRISNSVVPRPDRPWDDDATSNAPKVGRKRRLSSTERDLDEGKDGQSKAKKSRGDTPQTPEISGSSSQPEGEGVKEVTKGVKAVELEEKEKKGETEGADDESNEETVVDPEAVPLPEEVTGELDETSSIASTPKEEEQSEEEAPKPDETPEEASEVASASASVEPEPAAEPSDEVASAEASSTTKEVNV